MRKTVPGCFFSIFILFCLLFLQIPLPIFSGPVEIQKRLVLGGEITAPPIVSKFGEIIFSVDDRYLYFFSTDGELVKKTDLQDRPADVLIRGPGISTIVGFENDFLRCISPDGDVIWEQSINGFSAGVPVMGPRQLLYVPQSGSGETIDTFTMAGRKLWTYRVDGTFSANIFLDPAGNCIVATQKNRVIALDRFGNELWEVSIPSSARLGCGVPEVGSLLVSGDAELILLNFNGRKIWNSVLSGNISCIGTSENRIWVGNRNGLVYVLGLDGKVLTELPVGDVPISVLTVDDEAAIVVLQDSLVYIDIGQEQNITIGLKGEPAVPVMTADGRLFVGTSEWVLTSYSVEKTPSYAGWYRGTGNNGNTGFVPGGVYSRRNTRSIEFSYLLELAKSPEKKQKLRCLEAIEKRILAADMVGRYEDYSEVLRFLIEEGVISDPVHNSPDLIYPDVRAKAVLLLGMCADSVIRDHLVAVSKYEYDDVVLAAYAQAFGTIGFDPTGTMLRRMADFIGRQHRLSDRLADSIIDALAQMLRCNGQQSAVLSFDMAERIMNGNVSRSIRKKALDLLTLMGDSTL